MCCSFCSNDAEKLLSHPTHNLGSASEPFNSIRDERDKLVPIRAIIFVKLRTWVWT